MSDRLSVYAFGALHAILILLLVIALFVAGGNIGALSGIGTAPGIAIGLWLALLSWGATGWALRGASLTAPDVRDVLGRSGLAGFAAGALFVVGLFVGFALSAGDFEPAAVLFLAFASLFAGVAGSVVAMLLAALDVGLWKLTTRALT